MMDFLRWLGLAWFFDFLPGVDLIPDRIRKIIAAALFVPGAILTGVGWSMDQTGGPANSRAGGGLIEVQGTAEDKVFTRAELDTLLDLAESACQTLSQAQLEALSRS